MECCVSGKLEDEKNEKWKVLWWNNKENVTGNWNPLCGTLSTRGDISFLKVPSTTESFLYPSAIYIITFHVFYVCVFHDT